MLKLSRRYDGLPIGPQALRGTYSLSRQQRDLVVWTVSEGYSEVLRPVPARSPTGGKRMNRSRRSLVLVPAILLVLMLLGQRANPDAARWEREARNVTIVRDDWGIAHVFGKTDAEAVFGA